MGEAAWERAATDDEIARMCALLDEGLRHGALGLSVNHFDKDRRLRLVPGFFADDEEYRRAARRARPPPRPHVPGDHPLQRPRALPHRRRALRPSLSRAVVCAGSGPASRPTCSSATSREPDLGPPPASRRRRWRLLAQHRVQAARTVLRLRALHRVPARPGVERDDQRPRGRQDARSLADPAWRARARHEWDDRPHVATARVDRPTVAHLRDLRDGRRSARHLARRLRREERLCTSPMPSPSGCCAMASARSLVGTPDELDEAAVVAAAARSAHAHQHQRHRRAPAAVLRRRPERAPAHALRPRHRSAHDRGGRALPHRSHGRRSSASPTGARSRPVRSATSRCSPSTRSSCDRRSAVHDVPHGSWRFTRPPAGFRATIVGGVPDLARRCLHGRPPRHGAHGADTFLTLRVDRQLAVSRRRRSPRWPRRRGASAAHPAARGRRRCRPPPPRDRDPRTGRS